ncbi:peptide/nickel transport system ATP-binding protein [Amaricoccus macauensis]|uniref:Peptide/nickel transport system ATP-binding protein n=1 Tax=Amaricoccus macauensis TaxID=57001 RepID=A0A840SHY4_9RHOB|nr:ABC transporter ATP-binding protein [Amaricoccus macauensis]MBB5220370.1 peptide/nickel transport system ATP-binding protein [Amaricoccus macauensis]
MHEPKPLLEIDRLSVDFPAPDGLFSAVRDVSITIAPSEALAIIGESGSGKSVTANAVMGLLDAPPARVHGDVRFEGRSLFSMPDRQRRDLWGRRIAMVFQDPLTHLNPVYPVGWQVTEVCRIHGMARTEADRRAMELLDRVGIPDVRRRMGDFPHEFSGGQRQRVMIAMAMALSPDLLIADEPTTALDVTVQAQILDLLRDLRTESGMALMMITHDLGVAADIAERVVVMRRGEIVEEGALDRVFAAPVHPYTRQLLTDRSEEYRSARPGVAPAVLELDRVGVHYGTFEAVRDVTVTLRKGEILGIVGESGSGKSSLASAILKLRRPSSGNIRFHGRDIYALGREEETGFHRGVQAIFQDPFSSLNPRMTVLKVISEPWLLHRDVLPRDRWRGRAAELLDMVGLTESDLDKYPAEFSGGQRQRIAIARALALEPEVIVCDEAVSALDMTVQAQVITLLADLRTRLGLSYVFIAHDLTLIRKFADHVLVMKAGDVVEQGVAEEVFSRPSALYTRQLIASSPVPDPRRQAERRTARRRTLVHASTAP